MKTRPTEAQDVAAEALGRLRQRLDQVESENRDLRKIERFLEESLQDLRTHQEELRVQNDALREAQAEVEDSQRRYQILFDLAPVGYFTIDSQSCITGANVAACTMLGRDRQHLIGKPLLLYVSPDQRDALAGHFRQVLKGTPATLEIDLQPDNDRTLPVQLQSAPAAVELPGRARCLTAALDITERRVAEQARIEALRQAELTSRAKSAFLANISHELRTPLNGIMGFAEIIRDQILGPVGTARYVNYAADIHAGATHLLDLISDILDLSKIEAGKFALHRTPLQLNALFDAVFNILGESARAAGLTLARDIPDPPPSLVADERATRQMLLNLISNAIKFTPPGGQVRVTARTRNDGGTDLAVADTGIGIPERDHQRVFVPFEQSDANLTRANAGTGLGLPLVKSLIQQHGGHLTLASTPSEGTTVTLHFPPA